eukprot:Rhum_TRINITY_DN14671_c0_g1::Rhum_TRINITY_DN14671_c0_g1_i2::g.106676::m.106676
MASPFTVLVAADMFGDKHNLELQFPHVPTLQDLEAQIAATYNAEFARLRPSDLPAHASFALNRLQAYDEAGAKWSDLLLASQLKEGVQLYAFQREAPWHVEVQKAIPPPTRPGGALAAAHAAVAANQAVAYSAAAATAAAAGGMSVHSAVVPAVPAAPAQPTAALVATLGAAATMPTALLPDNATHDEKVRAVFEEFDVNTNKVVETEEFLRAYKVLNFDLPAATVLDLFQKADTNRDGVISFEEWQRFCEMYPTMLDSLYFRARDHWEDFRQKQEIRAARDELEAKKQGEKQAGLVHSEAQHATNCQEKRLVASEQALSEIVEGEREAKNRLLEGQRDTEAALRERAQRAQDLDLAKERERQRTLAHNETQRDTDAAEQTLAWQEQEQAASQEKERQSAQLMLEAQRETERCKRAEQEAASDLTAARDREQHANLALLEEKRQTELAEDRMRQAEMELQQRVARFRDLELRSGEAAATTQRETTRRDEEDRQLHLSREAEQAAHVHHLEAQRAVEDQDKKVLAEEAEKQAFLQRRKQVEDQEKPLLEQEVRLREQRESLEECEAKLRTDATLFHGTRAVNASPYRDLAQRGA